MVCGAGRGCEPVYILNALPVPVCGRARHSDCTLSVNLSVCVCVLDWSCLCVCTGWGCGGGGAVGGGGGVRGGL